MLKPFRSIAPIEIERRCRSENPEKADQGLGKLMIEWICTRLTKCIEFEVCRALMRIEMHFCSAMIKDVEFWSMKENEEMVMMFDMSLPSFPQSKFENQAFPTSWMEQLNGFVTFSENDIGKSSLSCWDFDENYDWWGEGWELQRILFQQEKRTFQFLRMTIQILIEIQIEVRGVRGVIHTNENEKRILAFQY
jgi:hypothetical protein